MVTPIDAVTFGISLNEAGQWREARPATRSPKSTELEDPLRPARGMLLGLAVSGALWTGLLFAGRMLLDLISKS